MFLIVRMICRRTGQTDVAVGSDAVSEDEVVVVVVAVVAVVVVAVVVVMESIYAESRR